MNENLKKKITLAVACTFIVSVFLWLFYSNFLFSSSYDLLLLKDIDELWFQGNLQLMRDDLSQGRWLKFLANSQSGYGNLYWLIMFFSTLPFHLLGWDSLVMVIPEISWICFALFLGVFYKIGRSLKYPMLNVLMVIAMMMTNTVFFDAMTRFHIHGFLALVTLASFLFLFYEHNDKNLKISGILMGVALGLKLTTLFVLPIYFYVLNRQYVLRERVFSGDDFIKTNKLVFIYVFFVAVFVFSPILPLLPLLNSVDFQLPWQGLLNVIDHRINSVFPLPIGLWQLIKEDIFDVYYGWPVFGVGILGALYLLRDRKNHQGFFIGLLALLCVVCLLPLALVNLREGYSFRFYILPFFLLFNLVYLEVFSKYNFAYKILAALFYISLIYRGHGFTNQLRQLYTLEKEDPLTVGAIKDYESYKGLVPITDKDAVYLDVTVAFPVGLIKNYKNLSLFYDDAEEPAVFKYFIVSKKAPHAIRDCEALQKEFGLLPDNCLAFKKIIEASGPEYKSVFENEKIKVIEKI